MYKSLFLGFGVLALTVTLSSSALAGGNKGNKGAKHAEKQAAKAVFTKYDVNNNRTLDPDERETLRKDFATDPSLKSLDKNSDGTLDDAEIDALKPGHQNGKKGKKAK